MANQKERFQPASGAIAFVFMLFSQALEDRHFTKHESVPQNVAGIIKAQRLIEIAGKQIDFAQREIFFRNIERTQENLDRRVQTRGFYSSKDWLLFVRGMQLSASTCARRRARARLVDYAPSPAWLRSPCLPALSPW